MYNYTSSHVNHKQLPFYRVRQTRYSNELSPNETSMPSRPLPAKRRYRGKTPAQLRAERRERLITAGLDLFGTVGFANAPIEKLCSTSRVATRHFYEQFDSRESLLRAVFDDSMDALNERINSTLTDESRQLPERVSDTIRTIVLYLLEDPRRGHVVVLESVGVSADMERHRRDRMHSLGNAIVLYANHLVAEGMLPERDYHFPAVGLVGMFNELIAEWLVQDTGLSAGEMAREAVILFRAMITGAREYKAT